MESDASNILHTVYLQVGKKYEVSDNAVRKWMKTYELPSSAKELKELVKTI